MNKSWLAAAVVALVASGPANAALVIDDFFNYPPNGYFPFGTVQAYKYPGAEQLVATASSSNGSIVGGERDLRVEITDPVGYVGDNNQASALISNGYFGPYGASIMSLGIGLGAEASFLVQYDGIDGSAAPATGLDLNIANYGSKIELTSYASLFLSPTGQTNFTVRLTDMAGQAASLTRAFDTFYGPIVTLDYGFADYEAVNTQLDLSHIGMIELLMTQRQQSYLDGWVSLMAFGVAGGAYTPTNVIDRDGGSGNQTGGTGGSNPVPEPGALALLGLGFLAIGRRRAKNDAGSHQHIR